MGKEAQSIYKDSPAFDAFYTLPVARLLARLDGIKKKFKKVAFIGPNPYTFLRNMPADFEVEKFTFIDASERSAEHSYAQITKMCEDGSLGDRQPDEIEPKVMDEEKQWATEFPQ